MKKIILIVGSLLIIIVTVLVWRANTPYRYLIESTGHLSSGKIAKAIKILKEAQKKYPDNYKVTFALARANLLLGETEQANKLILKGNIISALKRYRDFQDFLLDLAEANHHLGNRKYSRFLCTQYLNYQDENEISKRTVKNYIRAGQIISDNSLELWEKAYNIAYALKESELKESLKALLLPKYLQATENLRIEKKYNYALEILKKAKIIGTSAEVNYLEALVYNDLGETDLAQKQFEEAIQLEPNNDDYKISYANALKAVALKTKDQQKKTEYFEKIKLLLGNNKDNPKIVNILNKIISLNAKFQITQSDLKITMIGDYSYPSLTFKIKPIAEANLKSYKIIFLDENKNQIDEYKASITTSEFNQTIEVICRNPVNNSSPINAKLFVNDEFVKEYTNK